jgi:acetyltransferase
VKNLFSPKNIAVIGVSRDPNKIGYIVFDNLISGYKGKTFGINPNADQILGQTIYKSVVDLPVNPELAVICVPEKLVAESLMSCGKKGVKFAIIITAGFSESGTHGREHEAAILKIAKKYKIRILGPNCLGVINNFNNLNASFATSKLPGKYRLGIFSQSGAMGAAILDYANGTSFGFSYFVSLGNKSDISEKDILESWLTDENVEVGVGYLEDIKDGPGFLRAAQKFTQKKPLIILKGGMTKEGSRAANLHTAALVQDDVVFSAALSEAGVVLAKNLNDLFELAVSFSMANPTGGNRLAIVSNAGGPSVLAADACATENIELASLSAHTINTLTSKTFAASALNPIDLRGDARPEDFRTALSLCQKDPNVDGILVIITPQAMTDFEPIAWEVVKAAGEGKKPIYVNLIGGELVDRANQIIRESGVPTFTYPERAVRSFRFQADFYQRKSHPVKAQSTKHPRHLAAHSIIKFSKNNVDPAKLAALLSIYGVPMAKTIIARNEKEAEKALDEIKPPVVMKISSPDILHKTDVGGILLGIETKDQVREAFQTIIKNVKKNAPKAKIEGVTIMETAKEGLELIIGAKKDPVFGTVVMFGAGGILVELISDFVVAVEPFDRNKIEKLIEKTLVYKIIKGYRGNGSYDKSKLISAILAVGRLAMEHPEIKSIEINPLVLEEKRGGAMGLDAKIELTG